MADDSLATKGVKSVELPSVDTWSIIQQEQLQETPSSVDEPLKKRYGVAIARRPDTSNTHDSNSNSGSGGHVISDHSMSTTAVVAIGEEGNTLDTSTESHLSRPNVHAPALGAIRRVRSRSLSDESSVTDADASGLSGKAVDDMALQTYADTGYTDGETYAEDQALDFDDDFVMVESDDASDSSVRRQSSGGQADQEHVSSTTSTWKTKLRIILSNAKNTQYIKPTFNVMQHIVIMGLAHRSAAIKAAELSRQQAVVTQQPQPIDSAASPPTPRGVLRPSLSTAIIPAAKGKPSHFASVFVDIRSRLWLTYRHSFPLLNGSSLTSDVGWGCMLRAAQMMIANALQIHLLGREWMITSPRADDHDIVRAVVRLFDDDLQEYCPLSIHNILRNGSAQPGIWFSPTPTCSYVTRIIQERQGGLRHIPPITCYMSQDSVINIAKVCQVAEVAGVWTPVIILVPLMLGLSKINPDFFYALKRFFQLKQCIGMLGGKPKHALYFIGFQGDNLIGLDPHICQPKVDTLQSNFPLNTYHCTEPRKVSFKDAESSIGLGFYCQRKSDLDALKDFHAQEETLKLFCVE